MATSPSYDRDRAKRYKKWWARQKGSPQGQLIEVPSEHWQKRKARPVVDETRGVEAHAVEAAGGDKAKG